MAADAVTVTGVLVSNAAAVLATRTVQNASTVDPAGMAPRETVAAETSDTQSAGAHGFGASVPSVRVAAAPEAGSLPVLVTFA